MTAHATEPTGTFGPAPGEFTRQAAALAAVAAGIDGAALAEVASGDLAAAMAQLTTAAARIDGLRVHVARQVRDRQCWSLAGARNLRGFLAADPRLADDAGRIASLAARAEAMPQMLALLDAGQIGLAQAGTVCWQISRLPQAPRPAATADGSLSPPDPGAAGPDAAGDADAGPTDATDGGDRADAGQPGGAGQPADDGPAGDADGGEPGCDGGVADYERRWTGWWRAGDVHAAADTLFAQFAPRLDSKELRVMGAQLQEAADPERRASDEAGDYARRSLRISKSLGDAGEISGRLHAEAAAQVIAVFEALGGPAGPDDTRTKAQRWADVLIALVTGAGTAQPEGSTQAPATTDAVPAANGGEPTWADDEPGDDQPCPDDGHGRAAAKDGTAAGAPVPGLVPTGFVRPRLVVTITLDALLGRPLAGGGLILGTGGPGPPITAEAVRRLGCDAEIIRMVTAPASQDGGAWRADVDASGQLTRMLAEAIATLPRPLAGPSAVIDLGRKNRGWTPRQRDALTAQYGGQCGFGRCQAPIEVFHHIVHWCDGGTTCIDNGFPLCSYHHWLVHEGGWRVKKLRGGRITLIPPPPGWQPGTIYRHGKPVPEAARPGNSSSRGP